MISALEPQTAALRTARLQEIVDTLTRQALIYLPPAAKNKKTKKEVS